MTDATDVDGTVYMTRSEFERVQANDCETHVYVPDTLDFESGDIGEVRARVVDGVLGHPQFNICSVHDYTDEEWAAQDYILSVDHHVRGRERSEWVELAFIETDGLTDALDAEVDACRAAGMSDAAIAAHITAYAEQLRQTDPSE